MAKKIIFTFLLLWLFGCDLSKSPLLNRDDIPNKCKVALEACRYSQKVDAGCSLALSACFKQMDGETCHKLFPNEPVRFQACFNLLQ